VDRWLRWAEPDARWLCCRRVRHQSFSGLVGRPWCRPRRQEGSSPRQRSTGHAPAAAMVMTRLRRVIPTERFVEAGTLAGALVTAVAIVRRRVMPPARSPRRPAHRPRNSRPRWDRGARDLCADAPDRGTATAQHGLMIRPRPLAGQTAVDADGQRQRHRAHAVLTAPIRLPRHPCRYRQEAREVRES
jgi:hypothetical protein